MKTRKYLLKCAISFIIGGVSCFYLFIYSILDLSVGRLHVLNAAIYEGTIKMDMSSMPRNIAAIIYDDIDFYTFYRSYYPKFMTGNLDLRFCMAFRDDPSTYNIDVYFDLVHDMKIKDLIISRAEYCFGRG